MKNAIEAAEDYPVKRMAFFFALVAVGLLGVLLGGWLTVDMESGSESAQRASSAEQVIGQPSAGGLVETSGVSLVSVALLLAALLMMVASLGLLWQVRRCRADSGPRDPATGLYRRSYVDEAVANQIARDDRRGFSQLALVCLQIDYLDDVTRRYGGQAVETIVDLVGRQIRGQSREGDWPMLEANGLFSVYLQCEELEQATAFCRRLSMLLSREQLEWRGDVVKISTSMGVAVREHDEPLDSFRRRVIACLDEAQQQAAGERIVGRS